MHTNFQRLFFHLTFHSNLYFSFINRIIEFKCSNWKFKFINLSPIFFFSIATCTTTFNNTTFRLSFLLFSRGDVLVPRRGFGLFKPKNIYSNNRAIYIYFFPSSHDAPVIFINGVYARSFRVLSKNTWKGCVRSVTNGDAAFFEFESEHRIPSHEFEKKESGIRAYIRSIHSTFEIARRSVQYFACEKNPSQEEEWRFNSR